MSSSPAKLRNQELFFNSFLALHRSKDSAESSSTSPMEGDEEFPFPPPSSSSTSPTSSSAVALNWTDVSDMSPSPASEPVATVEKEHMFEKVVTPSDVGKLNRLVIPKQHAEKYFPLDGSTHEKGLLLSFEDRNGKPWRFRYSYWNSSQSYVMTKGWSRFVKEKRLDAGDTVSFYRGMGEADGERLFIDWKRRPDPHFDPPSSLRIPRFAYQSQAAHNPYLPFTRSPAIPWPGNRFFPPAPASNYFYFRSQGRAPPMPKVLDSFPVAQTKSSCAPKRVRLFGVNLEQPPEDAEDSTGLLHLQLQLKSPLPSSELRLGTGGSVRTPSSSSKEKSEHMTINSPTLDLDI